MASRPLKILILAAEVVPFAKVGGLADVVGALPKALQELGHDVRVAMPRYGQVKPERFKLTTVLDAATVNMASFQEQVSVCQGTIGNSIPVYMIDAPRYFDRENIYGYTDDGERFILFCRAALVSVRKLGWSPDIIHCNDWQTGIVPNWMHTVYRDDPFFANTATAYTIHNLAYQGIFGYRILEVAGVATGGFLYPQIPELANVVDIMGRGILFADAITTVSERYAQEILTPTFGEKLDPLLRSRRERLFGILNGIDYQEMNPATDRYIHRQFDQETLDKRAENKHQHYHEMFQNLAARYPEQVAIFLTFNTELAQCIYAGSDMFLMPSRFEPCGLGQLIAMRYGSVPIVHSVGGLADTVQEYNPRTGEGNGFAFTNYDPWELFAAIVRALEVYRFNDIWLTLQQRGMAADHSWQASAIRYVEVYRNAIAFHQSGK